MTTSNVTRLKAKKKTKKTGTKGVKAKKRTYAKKAA
jgi:hypothetical protein